MNGSILRLDHSCLDKIYRLCLIYRRGKLGNIGTCLMQVQIVNLFSFAFYSLNIQLNKHKLNTCYSLLYIIYSEYSFIRALGDE